METSVETPSVRSTIRENKVPEVTLAFWIVKILSTTVGETGADFLAVNVGLGQTITIALMGTSLAVVLAAQLSARTCVPWLYWLAVVLVSIVGTQITDLMTDTPDIRLALSTAVFAVLLVAIFVVWYREERTLSIHAIVTRKREVFYWSAVLCTFALGTAAGDLATEALGLGFTRGVLIFGALIAIAYAGFRCGANAVLSFWIAYVLTRPFGASLGDLLTQSKTYGGLGFGALWTSALFLCAIVGLVALAHFARTASVANSTAK